MKNPQNLCSGDHLCAIVTCELTESKEFGTDNSHISKRNQNNIRIYMLNVHIYKGTSGKFIIILLNKKIETRGNFCVGIENEVKCNLKYNLKAYSDIS